MGANSRFSHSFVSRTAGGFAFRQIIFYLRAPEGTIWPLFAIGSDATLLAIDLALVE